MKMAYKLVLCVLALFVCLTACGRGEESGQQTQTTGESIVQTAASDTASASPAPQLADAGKANFTLIRPDFSSDEVTALMQQIAAAMRERSGVEFALATDWVKRGSEPDSESYEILIGTTNRAETAKAASELGYGGWVVEQIGHKIVVYGNTLEAQTEATEQFIAALIDEGQGKLSVNLPEGGIRSTGEADLFAGGTTIGDYVIIAAKDEEGAALTLQKAISKKYGVDLEIKDAGSSETAREILVGDCDRAAAIAALSGIDSPIGYKVIAEGEKIMLLGKSAVAVEQAVEAFCETYINSEYSVTPAIPAGLVLEQGGLGDTPYRELSEGADVRIMSFNILAELWNDKLPVEGRDSIVAETILTYAPDVVGLQEVTDRWYDRLTPMIENTYAFLYPDTPEKKANYSSIAYNTEKVKLIDSGFDFFSQGNSRQLRVMTWGVFETIVGGERFAVINTHWDINNSSGPKNAYRMVQSGEMGRKVLTLQSEYNCPVFCTGDYNCNRDSDEYKNYASISGTLDAQVEAEVKVDTEYRSTHSVGSLPGVGDAAIDHITYTPGVKTLLFEIHVAPLILEASDHCPIMGDFVLGQ